jgi:hypothetical protein
MSSQHACVDCAALPVDDRPLKPRPATYGGPRSRRCATHHRALRAARRTKSHERRVGKVFGLEPGEYAELLAFQGGTCAIPSCRANGTRRRLAVDHDHACCPGPESCGKCVRGLVCMPHNYELLGKYAGDLQAGLDYLADPPAARFRRARQKVA